MKLSELQDTIKWLLDTHGDGEIYMEDSQDPFIRRNPSITKRSKCVSEDWDEETMETVYEYVPEYELYGTID